MAVDLKHGRDSLSHLSERVGVRVALMLALAAPTPAAALGARAPFTPPQAVTPGAAAVAASAPEAAPAATTDGLAGLRLGAHPLALIDGTWHRVGATVRGARLQRIDTHGVLLAHPDGRAQRLWLLPRETRP